METYYAPAERATPEQLQSAREAFVRSKLINTLMEAIPDFALLLNPERQIIAVNSRLLAAVGVADPESLIGLRPGELVECVNVPDGPGGCGTAAACSVCGAVNAIVDCLDSHAVCVSECRIRTRGEADGGALDLEVQASYLETDDRGFAVLAMRDISSEKRRGVLERTFFHDILNVTSGLRAIAELLSSADQDERAVDEYKRDLLLLTGQVTDEIIAQKQLLAAERGELVLNVSQVGVGEVLESVADIYRHHSVARDRTLTVSASPEITIKADAVLLRRVLGNLVKNALEATPPGGTVTLWAEERDGSVAFMVKNPGAMPLDVQKQVFQRSFSTRGEPGRGIGTHSVKLLAERFLGGEAWFVSDEALGTVFTVTLPLRPPAR